MNNGFYLIFYSALDRGVSGNCSNRFFLCRPFSLLAQRENRNKLRTEDNKGKAPRCQVQASRAISRRASPWLGLLAASIPDISLSLCTSLCVCSATPNPQCAPWRRDVSFVPSFLREIVRTVTDFFRCRL